ncbi:MAG: hypothetical protein KAS32_08425 [Candidatus Peribacteraceae bacterium]|nr:hypothetical protein [Candidatus Peribacteraceae bacterium]
MISLTTGTGSGAIVVELPNPVLGNTRANSSQLSVRRTLSNIQRTVISKSIYKEFVLTITNINNTQRRLLGDFFDASVDEDYMLYTDMDSNVWRGWVTNLPFDIVEIYSRLRTEEQQDCAEELDPLDIDTYNRRYSCTINFRGFLDV